MTPTAMEQLRGVWPAAITPFTESGHIDEDSACAHIDELADVPGVSAVVVNGHAGEATSLTARERRRIVELAHQTAGGRAAVVAGIMGEDTQQCVALAAEAEAAGADGLLLFPPTLLANGVQTRPEVATAFVTSVAAATPLPICLFQLAIASGAGYPTQVLIDLCRDVPNIRAVKEGSDNPAAYERNLRAIRALDKEVLVLSTNNSWLLESLAVGGDGLISGMGCVAADILCDLVAAVGGDDLPAARAANDRLFPLTEVFYRAPGLDVHNRMKVALAHLGRLPNAIVRPPLLALAPAETKEIQRAVEAAGLTPRARTTPPGGLR